MEDVNSKHSSREKKRKDTEKSPKKDKQAKSRKKASKSLSPQHDNAKTSVDANIPNEAESRESGLPSASRSASGASRDRDVPNDIDGAVSADASQKRERSKSRSRSGSRSRFSGFFRKKRYSMSETNLNRNSKAEDEKRCDSAENVTTGSRPNILHFRDGAEDDGSTGQLKSSLKTCPPHRFYDPRVQPRDRLLHMTVADAVKEQRLRRGNSAHRSPHPPETPTPTSNLMYMSSPSLAATLLALDTSRQSDLNAIPSTGLTPLKRKQKSDEVLRPSLRYVLPSQTLHDKRNRADTAQIEATRVDNPRLRQNSVYKDSSQSINLTNATPADTSSRTNAGKASTEQQQAVHKRAETPETQPILRPTHQTDGFHKTRRHSPSPSQSTPIEEAADAKIKRKASLSKFLELRQTLPSSISRSHRLSQSSDSGVTSRDTSPSAHADIPKPQPEKPQPSQAPPTPGKSPNPYVVSSISISPILITAPKVSITGSQHEAKCDHTPTPKHRPSSIKLEDSTGAESSSVSSSPQINSMTSSFRSSDQGYVNSDSDDDNASFSTPPEEALPGKRERAARTFNPGVLEKLLETTREKSQRELFPELDLDNWDKKRGRRSRVVEDLDESQLAKKNVKTEKAAGAEPRYVPRGVRRSKSDVDSRCRPSGALLRNAPREEEHRTRTGSADAFQLSPIFGREKVKFDLDTLSAASTSTLVVQDGALNGDHAFLERTDQKLVPVMGTMAQQKYRRTYSPSRIRKLHPPPKDEPSPTTDNIAPPKQVYVEGTLPDSPQTSNKKIPTHDPSERPQFHSATRLEPSPTFPRKGILKSPLRDRSVSLTETKSDEKLKPEISTKPQPASEIGAQTTKKSDSVINTPSKTEKSVKSRRKSETSLEKQSKTESSPSGPQKPNGSIETPPKPELNNISSQKSEIIAEAPSKTEFSLSVPQKPDSSSETPSQTEISQKPSAKDSVQPIPISITISDIDDSLTSISPASKTTISPDTDIDTTTTVSEDKSDISKRRGVNLSVDFPLIHGLEIGMHKVHSFSGYSLADCLKEQAICNRKVDSPARVTKSKQTKQSKFSNKKKGSSNTDNEKQSIEQKLDKEIMAHDSISYQGVDYTSRETEKNKLKIMVDKECQTSTWLINAYIKKKAAKPKKKVHSFSRKKKPERRGSTVSDTFIPTDLKKSKEPYHRSSLGDIRLACAAMASFTKDAERSLNRGASEKSISKPAKVKRHGEIITRHEPILPGSSLRSTAVGSSDESSNLPKPKKLSLAAVILLKNRLAKYREKKRFEQNSIDETPDDEMSVNSVASDTLITIENELNLSKLEVSKETDIVDDDIYEYEPEFTLGYTRKQLRFESLPSTEAIQSEEPLPPLPLLTSRRMRQRRESTLRERRRKCVQYCKKFIAFLFSHIGLCSLVVAYTILGGFIFQALEEQADYTVRGTIRERREQFIGKMVSLFFEFPRNEEGRTNFTIEANSTLLSYQKFIQVMTKDKGWDGVEGFDEGGLWTFASSLLYAITVTTTIGYGHVAPKTPEGRVVTIGYAIVGIPLTLLCLTNIGDVMATGFRLLYGKVCCGICCTLFKPRRRRMQVDLEKGMGGSIISANKEQQDKPKEVIHVPTSLCLLLISGYILAGAMLFSMWENWDVLTGSYFCFITLSTIGFGDIVPGMDSNAWAGEEKLVLCALYLVLGLSLIAMCFNLVQEDVKAKCRWLGMKLGIVDKHETPI